MARIYANENFSLPAADALRRLGHDVLTVQETGKASRAMPDEDVLAFARAESRILVTFNRRHFVRLHAATRDHAGIIVCTFDLDFEGQAARINAAVCSESSWTGRLARVIRPPRTESTAT
ncbi:MAG: DUF5615 family PIN-like protein [Bryobacterales bacterium]|nr:DUF5615 family PIN-like protein [Bryobacterales bacterium]